jgi:hypothetical protein
MNRFTSLFGLLAVLLSTSVVTPTATAADTLMSKLRSVGWDGIVGTWVDPETKGKKMTNIYRWKIKDHVIEVVTNDGSTETVALMGVSGKTGDVFHMGADSSGTSSFAGVAPAHAIA